MCDMYTHLVLKNHILFIWNHILFIWNHILFIWNHILFIWNQILFIWNYILFIWNHILFILILKNASRIWAGFLLLRLRYELKANFPRIKKLKKLLNIEKKFKIWIEISELYHNLYFFLLD